MPTGACLCDAVRYEIDEGALSPIWFCHCSQCRRARGTAFQPGAVCSRRKFRWLRGEDAIAEHRRPTGYRTRFCRTCGSPTPVFVEGTELVWIPVGTLDGDPGQRPVHHQFVASKAPWFEITDDLPCYDEFAPGMRRSD